MNNEKMLDVGTHQFTVGTAGVSDTGTLYVYLDNPTENLNRTFVESDAGREVAVDFFQKANLSQFVPTNYSRMKTANLYQKIADLVNACDEKPSVNLNCRLKPSQTEKGVAYLTPYPTNGGAGGRRILKS